jgi:hypothetical protein
MKKPVWEFRIPTIFALLVVAASIWVTGMLVRNGTFVVGHASPDSTPQHITVTNLNDTSASVVFITTSAAIAAVNFSDGKSPDRVIFQDNQQTASSTHQIMLSDLSPQTAYIYSLVIDGKTYSDPSYIFTTGPQIPANSTPKTISGTLLLSTGEVAKDALITLVSQTSQTLSTITDDQGTYHFDLSTLRNKDLSQSESLTDDSVLTLDAYLTDQHTRIVTLYSNAQPLPNVTLTQDYDFTQAPIKISTSSAETTFVLPSPIATQTSGVVINSPKNESSTIDSQPVLKGTGPKGGTVQISISPAGVKSSAPIDTTGHWQYRPTNSLPQGASTLTVSSVDQSGVTKVATTSFTVLPSGSQIAESATPSATLTPSPTTQPTATPTPTVTSPPTPTPTTSASISPTPTAVVTITPTSTPTPTITISSPTPTPFITVTPPPTGSVSAILISLVSVILIVTGTTLLFIL